MDRFVLSRDIAEPFRIKICQWLGSIRDAIDFVAVHHEQRGQLLRDFNSNPGQIIARASELPKFSDLLIVDFLRRAFDSHHDPFLIGTGPDDGVWKRVVKCE